MNDRQDDQGRLKDTSRETDDWLQSLAPDRAAGDVSERAPSTEVGLELLQMAARCYAAAGWAGDACRVFEQLGDDRNAAAYHEQLGRWRQAALCYARASDWQSAARCYSRCNLHDDAAECLLRAGQTLQAAWMWADLAHRYVRAEAAVREAALESEADRVAVELILARCDAGRGSPTEASRRLRQAVSQFPDLPPDANRRRLYDWAFAVAEALQRPDLTALIHAAAVSSGIPRAHEQWESWATGTLGDATGVPRSEDEST